jgi:hypothetical protein
LVSNIQTFTVGALLCTVHIMGSNLTWAWVIWCVFLCCIVLMYSDKLNPCPRSSIEFLKDVLFQIMIYVNI